MNSKSFLLLGIIAMTTLLTACEDEMLKAACDHSEIATIRDLTGLDGCGFVFELTDGTRLEPQRLFYCGTPPLPKEVTEDPLYNFDFVEGKQVKIGFDELPDTASICMAGKIVKIKCIEEIVSITEHQ